MVWVYAVILAFSAGLLTYVLSRTADRLTAFLGVAPLSHSILAYAAIVALAFLMIAQAPAMMLTCALILWFAGSRHAKNPISFYVQAGLLMLAVILGLASLPVPDFGVPPQIPKAAIMFAVYIVWVLVSALPMGAPGHGLFAAFGVALAIFVVGTVAFSLSTGIASDAIVIGGALAGAWLGMSLTNSHEGLAGQWVLLYLLGFLAASATYHGAWWLGLLGIAPVAVYTLLRKA